MSLLEQRLLTQHIAGPPLKSPEAVVKLLVGVQAQDHLGAKWSLGQRVKDATESSIDRAFEQGKFLRTHVLRPTWHYVLPADIRWLLLLTGPRVQAKLGYMNRRVELDGRTMARGAAVITRALEGGRYHTRDELAEVLRRAKIVATQVRLAHLLMYCELEGLICSGPMRGKRHSYALVAERAPAARVLAREEALGELMQRFMTGHAPATLSHFCWWSELPLKDARAALADVRSKLVSETIDGVEWWYGPKGAPAGSLPRPSAYLIPEYDEALTGSRDLAQIDLPRASDRKKWNDRFLRPVIVDGRRAGTWRRRLADKGVEFDFNLFAKLELKQNKALEDAVRRYKRYLGTQDPRAQRGERGGGSGDLSMQLRAKG
jgi:hypothetical protein